MIQFLTIESENIQALETVKKLAVELGLKITTHLEDDEDEDDEDDIRVARERRHDKRIPLSEVITRLNLLKNS